MDVMLALCKILARGERHLLWTGVVGPEANADIYPALTPWPIHNQLVRLLHHVWRARLNQSVRELLSSFRAPGSILLIT